MTSSLVADGIKIVRGNRVIINDFSSKLRSSEIVAMVGRNGAGKSTIMSALTGHLIPTEGNIHVLSDKKEEGDNLSSSVAFVSQGRPLYSSITVEQHTRLARDINDSFNYQWAKEKLSHSEYPGNQKYLNYLADSILKLR
ncbi:ATP-binding cassette domain-containing protein [Corynebacterium accolens]|uniref:ATP-binding cassette domain-containing protein n=1 Tax=Corynebacterium accolens TaxID=38284 RepID=UPI0025518A07|nr:ATP-binding cassette domain-containing protein [Corynebacterium accolens]MDK8592272.1 ATP-binding cassette domain-containing protein [Corynebacterium accolens]